MHPIFIFLSCLGISMALTPLVSKLAIKVGAVDRPNHRKVHTKKMPTLGGLAIFGAFFAGHLIFPGPDFPFQGMMLGGSMILAAGIVDDLWGLRPRWKLLVQFLAATVVIFYGQVYFPSFTLPFIGSVDAGVLGYILAYIWIMGSTNAINLIDGLDGLASGVSSIIFLTMYLLAVQVDDQFIMAYALIGAGSTMGFLIYNFHPAKIFMGDTGAMFLGYIIAILSMVGIRSATFDSLVVPVLILGVPVCDTLFALVRRKLKGQPVTQADKGHLHHILLRLNESQTKTVLMIYTISILFSTVAVVYNSLSPVVGVALMVTSYVVVRAILTTNFRKEKGENMLNNKSKRMITGVLALVMAISIILVPILAML
jgi:UDP-GlcNAc:undecaprenyl-phosphate GlcNAc-1-phosphate transferase